MLNTSMHLHRGVVQTSTYVGLLTFDDSKNEQKISPTPISFQHFLFLTGRKDYKIQCYRCRATKDKASDRQANKPQNSDSCHCSCYCSRPNRWTVGPSIRDRLVLGCLQALSLHFCTWASVSHLHPAHQDSAHPRPSGGRARRERRECEVAVAQRSLRAGLNARERYLQVFRPKSFVPK